MKTYRFRTSWNGKIILQVESTKIDHHFDEWFEWRDATVQDMLELSTQCILKSNQQDK